MQLAYNNSDILIDFKLRCITEATMIDDNKYSNDGIRLTRIVFNRKLSIIPCIELYNIYCKWHRP